jgi:CheY-like chemotaxis protein
MAALTILLIDDEPESCQFLDSELTVRGFKVSTVESLEEALGALEKSPFDAVILDVELSRAQRGRLMGALVDMQPRRPPLLVLASPSVISREEAYGWGASALMSKPINIDVLIRRIAELAVPLSRRPSADALAVRGGRIIKTKLPQQFLGRGGAVIPAAGLEESGPLLEGTEVRFELTVQGEEDSPIKGNGVVRYVSVDAAAGVPRAWGIEFSSFDCEEAAADSTPVALKTAAQATSYIPRMVH